MTVTEAELKANEVHCFAKFRRDDSGAVVAVLDYDFIGLQHLIQCGDDVIDESTSRSP